MMTAVRRLHLRLASIRSSAQEHSHDVSCFPLMFVTSCYPLASVRKTRFAADAVVKAVFFILLMHVSIQSVSIQSAKIKRFAADA